MTLYMRSTPEFVRAFKDFSSAQSGRDATHSASRCILVWAGCHRRCPRARGLQNDEPPLQPGPEPHPALHSYCCLSSSSETGIWGEKGQGD